MYFFPSSVLLVGHVTRYVPASRLEYEKTPIIFCSSYLSPVPNHISLPENIFFTKI